MTDRPDILDLIDHAIEDATSHDAMRWVPDESAADITAADMLIESVRRIASAFQVPTTLVGGPPREPVVDPPRAGRQRVLFVGGPCAGDLLAIPVPLPHRWLVMPPGWAQFSFTPDAEPVIPEPVGYNLRRVTGTLPGMFRTEEWQVYAVDGASAQDLVEAADTLIRAGWTP
jgi:hypothetical protein